MTKPKPATPEEIAAEFESRSFDADELGEIKKTRRRSPRIGEAKAEVYSFRVPPSYKERLKRRAYDDNKTESEIVREALDAYLG